LPKRGRKRYKGNATTISLWTKQPRVRPKATSTRRIQQQNNNKVRGQDTYLYALSGPTLSKADRHLPYKDKHDKEDNTYLIDLDKYTQSKAKPSRKNYKTRNNCKVQGQDTYLIDLDEYTQSKAESSRQTKYRIKYEHQGNLLREYMVLHTIYPLHLTIVRTYIH